MRWQLKFCIKNNGNVMFSVHIYVSDYKRSISLLRYFQNIYYRSEHWEIGIVLFKSKKWIEKWSRCKCTYFLTVIDSLMNRVAFNIRKLSVHFFVSALWSSCRFLNEYAFVEILFILAKRVIVIFNVLETTVDKIKCYYLLGVQMLYSDISLWNLHLLTDQGIDWLVLSTLSKSCQVFK